MTTVAAVLLAVASVGEPSHDVLRANERVWDVTTGDLNGDGLQDIVAYCSNKDASPVEKSLEVFFASRDQTYPETATVRIELPPSNGTAFVSESDGAPPAELVTVEQGAAEVLRVTPDGATLVRRIEFNSLLPSATQEPVFLREARADLDGDGIDEWLIPVPGGYEIWSGYQRRGVVPAPFRSELDYFSDEYFVSHRLPRIATFSTDETDVQGLAFLSKLDAQFAYGEAWSKRRAFRIPQELEENWSSQTFLEDINADGFPDLVLTQARGTINVESLTQIYLARAPFDYGDEPDAEFRNKGSFTTSAVVDVNGDNRLDILFFSVHIGVRNVLNYLFRKKVSVSVDLYLFEDGGFNDRPSADTNVTVEAPEGREQTAYTLGDFNGDGLTDAAVSIGSGTLGIFRSERDSFLSSRPWKELDMPAFGVSRRTDLDGNANDDLILFHPTGDHQKRIEIIRF